MHAYGEGMTQEPQQPVPLKIIDLNPRNLRGLAHPLRMRLLSSLRIDGPATASQLAQRLSESSGATSYHLRQLAEYGFVEDAPDRGKGRERWWRSTHDSTMFDDSLTRDGNPEVRAAANWYQHQVATHYAESLSTWIGTRDEWSQEWVDSSDMSDSLLRLTPELTAALRDEFRELVRKYRALAPEPGNPDSAMVHVHTYLFPRKPRADD